MNIKDRKWQIQATSAKTGSLTHTHTKKSRGQGQKHSPPLIPCKSYPAHTSTTGIGLTDGMTWVSKTLEDKASENTGGWFS